MSVCCQRDSSCPGAGPAHLERPWGVVGLQQDGWWLEMAGSGDAAGGSGSASR